MTTHEQLGELVRASAKRMGVSLTPMQIAKFVTAAKLAAEKAVIDSIEQSFKGL